MDKLNQNMVGIHNNKSEFIDEERILIYTEQKVQSLSQRSQG